MVTKVANMQVVHYAGLLELVVASSSTGAGPQEPVIAASSATDAGPQEPVIAASSATDAGPKSPSSPPPQPQTQAPRAHHRRLLGHRRRPQEPVIAASSATDAGPKSPSSPPPRPQTQAPKSPSSPPPQPQTQAPKRPSSPPRPQTQAPRAHHRRLLGHRRRPQEPVIAASSATDAGPQETVVASSATDAGPKSPSSPPPRPQTQAPRARHRRLLGHRRRPQEPVIAASSATDAGPQEPVIAASSAPGAGPRTLLVPASSSSGPRSLSALPSGPPPPALLCVPHV
ncbi:uncharacterized protein [Nothobranchius furzeri]|uniref:uncharacterized protein n=1 Tax=Nothobranchius furzeri TaxID=105023 RepID=UPI003904BC73